MRLSKQLIYIIILIASYGIGCSNSAEVHNSPEVDHKAELDHIIINEIFNEVIFYETSNVKHYYNWIQTNILKNCKYYINSNSNISLCSCFFGEILLGLPFYNIICLFDVEADIKLCFNFNDWKCFESDRSPPCFESEYREKIKECNSYRMLSNYINYYLDDLSSKNDVQSDIHIALNVEAISAVVDSVLDLVYFLRVNQDNRFIIDRAFDDIERDFRRDESGCCFQVINDNKRYLEELIKKDDDLVYFDVAMHMFWIVSFNPKPKKDIFGMQYVTIRPFNYECAYWIYL